MSAQIVDNSSSIATVLYRIMCGDSFINCNVSTNTSSSSIVFKASSPRPVVQTTRKPFPFCPKIRFACANGIATHRSQFRQGERGLELSVSSSVNQNRYSTATRSIPSFSCERDARDFMRICYGNFVSPMILFLLDFWWLLAR